MAEPKRFFWPAAAALLAFLAIVQILSALRESPIADEPAELAAGYSYLKTGDFRLNPEHPPLSKMIAALLLLGFELAFPRDQSAWSKADDYAFGIAFFRDNRPQLDAFLFDARLTAIFLTFCLGLAIALWARATFGPVPVSCFRDSAGNPSLAGTQAPFSVARPPGPGGRRRSRRRPRLSDLRNPGLDPRRKTRRPRVECVFSRCCHCALPQLRWAPVVFARNVTE
jgi:hypothetical protein